VRPEKGWLPSLASNHYQKRFPIETFLLSYGAIPRAKSKHQSCVHKKLLLQKVDDKENKALAAADADEGGECAVFKSLNIWWHSEKYVERGSERDFYTDENISFSII